MSSIDTSKIKAGDWVQIGGKFWREVNRHGMVVLVDGNDPMLLKWLNITAHRASEPEPCPDCKGGESYRDCPACEGTGLASEPAHLTMADGG
jgi:hypothetical protein